MKRLRDNFSHEWPYELASAYMYAKRFVIEAGYAWEIDWQDNISFDHIKENDFLREAAWVILSSGMRESVIRKKFTDFSEAFLNWESAQKIAQHRNACRDAALCLFNHAGKINAIITIAAHVCERQFSSVWESINREGVDYIARLPYMGPATAFHLAKNIGLPAAKPDRHLNRIAEWVGYSTPHLMCIDIADLIGEKLSVVDLVMWRYATLQKDYLEAFPSIPRRKTTLVDVKPV